MRQSAKQIIERGMKWIADNPDAWERLKFMVAGDVCSGAFRDGRELRIAYYVERLRNEMRVKIPNSATVYLSRRLEREIEGAKFTKAQSKINLLMGGGSDE